MWRALLFVFLAAFLLVPIAFWVLVRSGVDSTPVDCSGFAPGPGAWQAADPLGKAELAGKIKSCGVLRGADRAGVQQLLGPPEGSNPYEGGPPQPAGRQWSWTYGQPPFPNRRILVVAFSGDRVADVFTTPGPDP